MGARLKFKCDAVMEEHVLGNEDLLLIDPDLGQGCKTAEIKGEPSRFGDGHTCAVPPLLSVQVGKLELGSRAKPVGSSRRLVPGTRAEQCTNSAWDTRVLPAQVELVDVNGSCCRIGSDSRCLPDQLDLRS